jgi:hypothetical protein
MKKTKSINHKFTEFRSILILLKLNLYTKAFFMQLQYRLSNQHNLAEGDTVACWFMKWKFTADNNGAPKGRYYIQRVFIHDQITQQNSLQRALKAEKHFEAWFPAITSPRIFFLSQCHHRIQEDMYEEIQV